MSYSFISGATGGIGKAFAKSLALKGNNLFITGRSVQKLTELKAELLSINGKLVVEFFACDLTSEASRTEMLKYIDSNGILFNKIINVAGVDIQKGFSEYTREKVLFQIRVNCEATVDLTYSLLKRTKGNVEVLTISSMSGVSPMPYFALYSATKAMLTNLFTALHYEYKKQGVKITTVLPGGVYTRPDIIEDIKGQGIWGKLSSKTPEFVVEKSLKALRKNKVKYVPGAFNKILNFLMKLVPKCIVLNFIGNRWKKQSKDAF